MSSNEAKGNGRWVLRPLHHRHVNSGENNIGQLPSIVSQALN